MITVDELQDAERSILKIVQAKSFKEEISNINSNRQKEPTSSEFCQLLWIKVVFEIEMNKIAVRNNKYLRKLMALPFLPHHEIPGMFARLRVQATTQPLREIVQYIKDQWIESTIHPIKDWSIYGQPIKTNNDIEGIYYNTTT
ncbi:hypothetical protein QZH41_020540 [Actinostola sp. cb2023]|nr:hypothetical protein QZH41_020540 [Actinostola sp. cb2023]